MIPQEKKYEYRKLKFEDIDQSFTKKWSELLENALEPVAYMDPNYVLPAEKYLKQHPSIIRAVYLKQEEKELIVGLGIFTLRAGDFRLPFPHLLSYKTTHSFLTVLVIDKREADTVIDLLFSSLAKEFWYTAGVRFIDIPSNDLLANKIGRQTGNKWFEFWAYERAVYKIPKTSEQATWQKDISKKRLKNYRKAKRDIEELGELSWSYISHDQIDQTVIDNFLLMENSGWKGQEGTSLLANESQKIFFNSVVKRFAKESKIFFTELKLNDKIIASTCNLVLGEKAFAFKIGWDVEYKKYSPGVINEMEFLQYADQTNCSFLVIESGATESSFIESYWKQRWYLAEGVYSFHIFSKLINMLNNKARSLVKNILLTLKKPSAKKENQF